MIPGFQVLKAERIFKEIAAAKNVQLKSLQKIVARVKNNSFKNKILKKVQKIMKLSLMNYL